MELLKRERHSKILSIIEDLAHGHVCDKLTCTPKCDKMKRMISHVDLCPTKRAGGCRDCKQITALCCYHAKLCRQNRRCAVPFCEFLKFDLSKHQLRAEAENWRRLRARIEPLRQGVRPDVRLDARPILRPIVAPVAPEAGPSAAPLEQLDVEARPAVAPDMRNVVILENWQLVRPNVHQVEPEAGPSTAPHVQPAVGPSLRPTVGPEAGASMEPHVQPDIGSNVRPAEEPEPRPPVGPHVQSVAGSEAELSNLQAPAGPNMRPDVEPEVRPSLEPHEQPAEGSNVTRPVAPDARPHVGPPVRPNIGLAEPEEYAYVRLALQPFQVRVQIGYQRVDGIAHVAESYAQARVVDVLPGRPGPGLVQLPNPHFPPENWRQIVSAELRQQQVQKLVNSINRFYPPEYEGLIAFGNKMEKILFDRATSLPNYYQLIDEQLDRMPRELEDHRRLMLRAQADNAVQQQN